MPPRVVVETEHAGPQLAQPAPAQRAAELETPDSGAGISASPELSPSGWFARQKQDFALRKHVLSSEVWTPFQKCSVSLWIFFQGSDLLEAIGV